MTVADLVARYRARAQEAEALGATAPVGAFYRLVVGELEAVAGNRRSPTSTDAPDRLLDVREAAARLSVTPRWLYVHAGDFPFTVRLPGRRLRFREAGLAAWLAGRRP